MFDMLGIWGNLGVLVVAAACILVAGSKLERWANVIGHKTKLGSVFAGTVLLAVATSLPEIATSLTATLRGHTDLAVSNLLGGVIIQTMVLGAADVVGGKGAITGRAPSFGLLMQGVGLILILATALVAASVEAGFREHEFVSRLGPLSIAATYVMVQYVTMRTHGNPRWTPTDGDGRAAQTEDEKDAGEPADQRSLRKLVLLFGLGSLVVCGAGWTVVMCTESIAAMTGASTSFLGFTLVAVTTSLPEIGTTFAATRRGRNVTAIANVFGSNCFDVALLAVVCLVADGPLFADALPQSVFSAALGIVLTTAYLAGALERRDRSIMRMGWDSLAVLVIGSAGIWIVFHLGG